MKWIVISNIIAVLIILIFTQQTFSIEEKVKDVPSPGDRIKEDQIKAFESKVELDFDREVRFTKFTDTKSMDPVLDSEANAIEIIPKSYSEIRKGDIISYKTDASFYPVVHRVIETNLDQHGWYALTKGDNNPEEDPEKVRFEDVNGVVVALLY